MGDDARDALAEERQRAYIAKVQAETEKAKQESWIAFQKGRTEAALARMNEVYAQNKERELAEYLATDRFNFLFRLDDDIDDSSVSRCIDTLTQWHRLNPGCDIEVRLTSPGGSIIEGLALYDYLRELSRSGHKIITSAYGFAASMAGILLQAGDTRVMARESWLMIHEPRLGAIGTMGQINDRMEWIKRVNDRVIDIFFERSRKGEKKLKRDEIKARYDRKDWWVSAPEALEYGFIDEVR